MPQILKPRYIDPAGDPHLSALSVAPPFLFRNVTARVFPLKANMAVLTNFCDDYLNMDISPEIVHYAPAISYVYLMVLNYGSMAAASVQAQNVGWVGQHEVAFTMLLQRWREENGKLLFKDWATVSPFIYVDDELSLNTGREVYGWNKVAGTIDSAVPLWVTDPRAKLRQFDLSVIDFASAYTGASEAPQALLHIDLDPPPTFTEFPPDPRNPWLPIWSVPEAIANTASFLGSALDTALALRIRGYEADRSLESLLAMGGAASEKLKSVLPQLLPSFGRGRAFPGPAAAIDGLPKLFFDNVTLKQFRNPEDPALACYQALVNSKMGVDRLNRLGLLGDINLLRGDSSGGYTIQIHQYDSQPIIQTLGLEVASWSDRDSPDAVATLKPVLPFWLDVDLYYGKGELVCSRAPWGAAGPADGWMDEQKERVPAELRLPTESTKVAPAPLSPPLYNTTLGAATQPICGPFHFPDVTLQVYPLLVDRAKIDDVVRNYLNDPLNKMYKPGTATGDNNIQDGWHFETMSSYVYMVVTVYGDEFGAVWSGANNIGGFFGREVTFCVPVKWYDGNGNLISVAMMEPFTYSNSDRGVATDREVNGYNSIKATIESPSDIWLTPSGPVARRQFLTLATEVIPALNVGQKAQQRTLLEIDERDVLSDDDAAGWRDVADTWGRALIDDLYRKTYLAGADPEQVTNAKALALELLAHGAPFNRLIFKQYRDGEDLDTACYQALVHASSTIVSIYDLREIETKCHVRLHRQPGHLIADALGLKIKAEESADGEVVDVIQPVHPFWMRIGMREALATVACYRAKDGPWQNVHPWFEKGTLNNKDPKETSDNEPPPPHRRLAGQKPYFEQSGQTRVGGWLARVPGRCVPPRPIGDSLQDFPNKGDLEKWLPVRLNGAIDGADLHTDLRNNAAQWLRRSLVNEIAWVRICIENQDSEVRDKDTVWDSVESETNADILDLLEYPIQPGSIQRLTDNYSIHELAKIARSISDVGILLGMNQKILSIGDLYDPTTDSLIDRPDEFILGDDDLFVRKFGENLAMVAEKFSSFYEDSTRGIKQDGLAWGWEGFLEATITKFSLNQSCEYFQQLTEFRKRAFITTLSPGTHLLLTEAAEYVSSDKYKVDTKMQNYDQLAPEKLHEVRNIAKQARILSDFIENSLLDWNYPSRWRRLSYFDAREAIGALDEVQLVIDNILSSEWEDRGETRWANPTGGRKPNECIPDGPDIALRAIEQGLVRWPDPETGQDSEFWVAPLPDTTNH